MLPVDSCLACLSSRSGHGTKGVEQVTEAATDMSQLQPPSVELRVDDIPRPESTALVGPVRFHGTLFAVATERVPTEHRSGLHSEKSHAPPCRPHRSRSEGAGRWLAWSGGRCTDSSPARIWDPQRRPAEACTGTRPGSGRSPSRGQLSLQAGGRGHGHDSSSSVGRPDTPARVHRRFTRSDDGDGWLGVGGPDRSEGSIPAPVTPLFCWDATNICTSWAWHRLGMDWLLTARRDD